MDVLVSGKTSFKVEVPYQLAETGPKGPKPLIVYLHGRGETLEVFKRRTSALHAIDAYHLYIQGPYAELTISKPRERFGYSWYLYNGKQGSFVKSLEYTAEFIQEIIDGVRPFLNITRLCMLGFSMGGYQAAYFAFTRWKHTNELIVIGGRVKTELLAAKWPRIRHIKVLAVHGELDDIVHPDTQRQQIEILRNKGLDATFSIHPQGHAITPSVLKTVDNWLKKNGY